MIAYSINRFIHSIIRENKLLNLMEFLSSRTGDSPSLLDELIAQIKTFLNQEDEVLFDQTKLKYLVFLDSIKGNIEEISSLKDKEKAVINYILFSLYEIPRKRNNLLLIFLTYFYMQNRDAQGGNLFKILHLYFLIIAYRKRLPKEVRRELMQMDQTSFHSLGDSLRKRIRSIKRKFPIIENKIFHKVGFLFGAASIVWFVERLPIAPAILKGDILSASTDHATLWKVAFDSIFIGRVSDPIVSTISNFWYENILLIIAFTLLIQAFKTSLTTVFFNSLLTKVFEFLWVIIKMFSRAFFYFYNTIVYELETVYIFSFINFCIRKRLAPNGIMILLFTIIYCGIFMGVIFLYLFLVTAVLPIELQTSTLVIVSFLSTLLTVFINFEGNCTNFKNFLLEIDHVLDDEKLKTIKSAAKS